jgi:hypothetical protein
MVDELLKAKLKLYSQLTSLKPDEVSDYDLKYFDILVNDPDIQATFTKFVDDWKVHRKAVFGSIIIEEVKNDD